MDLQDSMKQGFQLLVFGKHGALKPLANSDVASSVPVCLRKRPPTEDAWYTGAKASVSRKALSKEAAPSVRDIKSS